MAIDVPGGSLVRRINSKVVYCTVVEPYKKNSFKKYIYSFRRNVTSNIYAF